MGNIINIEDLNEAISRLRADFDGLGVEVITSRHARPSWSRVEITATDGPLQVCGRVTIGSNSRRVDVSIGGQTWIPWEPAAVKAEVCSALEDPWAAVRQMAKLVDQVCGSVSLARQIAQSVTVRP
jgi:hypothetical protein